VDGFLNYILEKWVKEGLIISSPYPRIVQKHQINLFIGSPKGPAPGDPHR